MSQFKGSPELIHTLVDKQLILNSNVFFDLVASTFYTVMGYVCLDIIFAITLHYISKHNDPQAVAGLGLAFTLVNVLMIPLALGTNQSLNLHSSQALGANKPKLAQTYFSLTMLFHILYFIPLGLIILALQSPIAMMINEEDRELTSYDSQTYLYFLLPSSLFAILYEAMKSFLIAHKVFQLFMYIQVFTTLLHIFWCELFINYLNLGGGIPGAGLAIIITESLNCVILILVIYYTSYKNKIFKNYLFNLSIQRHWKLFMSFSKTSFPIVSHIYADFFVFFLLNFIAVGFGTIPLNAQLALSNTANMYYKFPVSLSIALMTYIGNEMGSKNIYRAKLYAWIGVLLFVIFTSVSLILLSVFRIEWASFYAQDEEIKNLILEVYPIFAFGLLLLDCLQGTLSGILKGIDKTTLVNNSTLIVYYLIGIPLVIFSAYDFGLGLKVYGIWLAFGIVNAVLSILYVWSVFTTNWNVQADQILKRIENQQWLQSSPDNLNVYIDEYHAYPETELCKIKE